MNIVIIGMPGSGKTTIGLLVSKKLNRKFIDMDEFIAQKENMTITDMFAIGEKYFRNAETECARELSRENSAVIAAGGGIVRRKENINYLKQSSIIVFLNRPLKNIISDIDIKSRPLLKNNSDAIYKLYNERIHLYKECGDIEIINDKTKDETANSIAAAAHKLMSKMDSTYFN